MEQQPISLESEVGFRVLFECATISILVISEQGVIELASPCAETLFGYQPAELTGKPIEVLIPDDLRSRHAQHRKNYFDKPRVRPMGLGMELHGRKKDGKVFPVAISLAHYTLTGEKLAVAFVTDITDHMLAKRLVAEREALLRNIADNSPVMICVSDPNKNCTYFNHTWLNYTGRSMEEELGTGWVNGIHPNDVESCLLNYYQAFESRVTFVQECRLRMANGQYHWVHVVGKPAYIDTIFTGYTISCNDIHDQKMAKEELEELVRVRTTELYEALDREKKMSELKSRFVSMASHEFRIPLTVISSSAMLIEQYEMSNQDPRIQKHILRIRSSLANLTTILDDFLSLDKLEQGKVVVELDRFSISDFMKEVAEEVQTMRKKNQQVNLVQNGENTVTSDKKMLRYIVMNLLSNALKYSPEGGQVNFSSHVDEKSVTITVEDKGIGIPEEEQILMYSKFFRATNTANMQGTGLGLTIVKRYVELLAGQVSFVSRVGEGTTFTVRLPTVVES